MEPTRHPFVHFARSLASFAGAMLALLIGFYAVVLLFGVTKSVWECEGTHFDSAELGAAQTPDKLTIAFERYRWFLFWADSEGNARMESHELGLFDYHDTVDFNDDLAIRFGTASRPNAGMLSLLSRNVSVSYGAGIGWFEGQCRIREE
jgi:hypothetical protein